jgi:hypothetical protein
MDMPAPVMVDMIELTEFLRVLEYLNSDEPHEHDIMSGL